MAETLWVSTSNVWEFQFLYILTKACDFLLIKKIYYRHLSGYVVVSHCGFDLHFPNDYDAEHLFICFLAICILLWINVYSNTLSIFLFSIVSKLSLFFQLGCTNNGLEKQNCSVLVEMVSAKGWHAGGRMKETRVSIEEFRRGRTENKIRNTV